jgi:hypothetical protein
MESKGTKLADGSEVRIAQRMDGTFEIYMLTSLRERAYGFWGYADTIEEARIKAAEMADAYESME